MRVRNLKRGRRGNGRRTTVAPPMAASAGAIQCAAAMVVTSGNGGLEMTKTKTKRQTVGDCEETLRALEVKREQLIARGESLPELWRGAAYAVVMGITDFSAARPAAALHPW